ncbi:MAG: hypothetical protein ACKVRP_13025, partial [Bacteroidota bacterium]
RSFLVDDSSIVMTSYLLNALAYDTEYFWRVEAINEIGVSGFTAEWNFRTVISPPAAPSLLSPANDMEDQPINLEVVWSASNGATSYHVQVAIDSLFGSLVVNDSLLTDTSYSVSTLDNLTEYYWRVRARNLGGYSPLSGVFHFTTIIAPPGTPVLAQPVNGAGNLPTSLLLTWQQSSLVSSYHLQLSPDSLFSTILVNDSTLVDTLRNLDSLELGTTYYWRVRGENMAGISGWSETRSFATTMQVTRQYPVSEGWNLVAVPLSVADFRAQTLYPDAASNAFAFDPVGGYVARDTMKNGEGYWLKFKTDIQVELVGDIRLVDTVAVVGGWNLIGGLSEPVEVNDLGRIPPSLVTSDFFAYNGGGYASADTLLPSIGYWVKADQNGYLILNFSPATASKASLNVTKNKQDVPKVRKR